MLDKDECLENSNRLTQIKIHELLAKLIQELSQLMNWLHRLLVIYHEAPTLMQNDALSTFEQKLQKCLFNFTNSKYKLEQQVQLFPSLNVFRRFSCRAMQILLPYKQRIQSCQYLRPALSVIARIKQQISVLHQNLNIYHFMEQIYSSFSAVARSMRHELNKSMKKSVLVKQDDMGGSKQKKFVSTTRNQRSKSFQAEPQYQKKLKTMIRAVNARFKTIDCMDLDYSYFRSSAFQARNTTEIFQDYYSRNSLIQHQIKGYEKEYKDYVLKRQKRNLDKKPDQIPNRLSLDRAFTRKDSSHGKDKKTSIYFEKKDQLKTNNWATDKFKNSRFQYKKYSVQQSSNLFHLSLLKEKQPLRTKYQIKSIVLNSHNLSMEPDQNNMKRLGMKQTLRQLQVTRRKYSKFEDKSFLKNIKQMNLTQSPGR